MDILTHKKITTADNNSIAIILVEVGTTNNGTGELMTEKQKATPASNTLDQNTVAIPYVNADVHGRL